MFYYLFLAREFLLTSIRLCLLYILKKNYSQYDKVYSPFFSSANLSELSSEDLVDIIKKLLRIVEKNLLVVTLVSFFCDFLLFLEVFLVYLFTSLNSFFKDSTQTKSDESFDKPFFP